MSNLTFLDLGIFGDIICFDICLKNEFFRSCFQQSAKCKMTAQTKRKNHIVGKQLNFMIGFATKIANLPPPLLVFSV